MEVWKKIKSGMNSSHKGDQVRVVQCVDKTAGRNFVKLITDGNQSEFYLDEIVGFYIWAKESPSGINGAYCWAYMISSHSKDVCFLSDEFTTEEGAKEARITPLEDLKSEWRKVRIKKLNRRTKDD